MMMTNSEEVGTRLLSQGNADASGWYPYGEAGRIAEWDGHAWTGATRDDAEVTEPAPPKRHLFAFLTHPWFSLLVLGSSVVLLGAVLGHEVRADHWWWLLVVGVGMAVALFGFVLIWEPHLRFTALGDVPATITAGVVSGAVGVGLAYVIETGLHSRFGVGGGTELWLAGVIEESCKLLIPVVLWVVFGTRFRDPRTGFLLGAVSGATFGVAEGVEYVSRDGVNAHLVMAVIRPLAEVGHPLWTGFGAALIWFAAYRAGRLITFAGFVGWVLAMAAHSVHDGLLALPGRHESDVTNFDTAESIVESVVVSNVISVFWIVVGLLMCRHILRETVPPSAIATNPAHWRPRLVQWGIPKHHRTAAARPVGRAQV